MNQDPNRSKQTWIPLDDTVARVVQANAERHSRWPDMQNRWGLVLLSDGRFREAVEVFDRSLKINPRYGWAALNRVQALALAGDFGDARRALDKVDRAQPAALTLAAAFVDLLEGQIEAAADRLDSQDEKIARRLDVGRLRTAILRVQNPEQAQLAWEQLRSKLPDLNPALAAPWDPSGSVAARYLSFVPGLHQLWYEASTLLARMGRVERSEWAAAVALLIWSERSLHLYQKALLASFRGKDELAQRLYFEASQVDVTDPRPHVALAFHWSAQGDLDRALKAGAAALERAPRFPDLHYQMGLLLRAAGRTQEALTSFQRALDINPRYTNARLAEAGALFALEQWKAALAAYAQVLEAGLDSSDIHVHLGQIEEKLGHSDNAEAAYQQAIRLNPREAEAHYLIGDLYRRGGNHEAARKAWKLFLKLSRHQERVAEVERLLKSA